MNLSELTRHAGPLALALHRHGVTTDGLAQALGPDGMGALSRHEPAAVGLALERYRSHNPQAAALFRLLITRHTVPEQDLPADLAHLLITSTAAKATSEGLTIQCDIRPLEVDGHDYLIFSDMDASMTVPDYAQDHVLGAGAASLSLLNIAPRSRLKPTPTGQGRVLDLGTGCGVLSLSQSGAHKIHVTDVTERALAFATATLNAARALNPEFPPFTTHLGPWFEPVAGLTFDRIIANPPFVVGPATTRHIYRDSGLHLDSSTQLLVSSLADHLADGGVATIMGAWLHPTDTPWQQRVASWLPATGVRAWVLQRDAVDPYTYVGTWLRDENIDPRSQEGHSRSQEWIECLTQAGAEAIGFGFIIIQKYADPALATAPSEITCEDFFQPFDGPLWPEVEDYLDRMEFLATCGDPLDYRYQLCPGLALEDVSLARRVEAADHEAGFERQVLRLTRTDGPRWSHEIDEVALTILKGLNPCGLTARGVCEFAEVVLGLDEVDSDADQTSLAELFRPLLVDCIRHGLVRAVVEEES